MDKHYLLMTIQWNKDEELNLDTLAAHLGVSVDSLDKEFGIVNVDLENKIFSYQIDEAVLDKLRKDSNYNGPYSNPKIEPFGLEE
jgi:hypothetical protein